MVDSCILTWMELSCSKSYVPISILVVPGRIGEGLSHLSGVARERAVPLAPNLQVREDTWAQHLRLWKQQKVVRQEGRKETKDQFHNSYGSSAGTLSDIAGRREILRRPIFRSYLALGSSHINLNMKKKGHLTLVECKTYDYLHTLSFNSN